MQINAGGFPKTKKTKKTMDESEVNKIREENELIRAERAKVTGEIAQRFSMFKRNLLGAPIRAAIKAAIEGKPIAPA